EGGFAVALPHGVWYEEYADEGGARPRVLNGMLYALFGLHDVYAYLGDRDALRLFNDGVAAVKAELPRYDNRGHSYYDLLRTAPGPYHAIHVEQLDTLYALTDEPIFTQYRDRWAAYRDPSFVTRLLTRPTPLRMAVAFVNAAVIWLLMLGVWAARRRR
ncbi:MAG TPA: D-glucuronyl C5-epimerase family protein, partial [Armatimonadota bacterium]|nr:D-glucuronyl C5-epimerase family protein [Armatimonadota bacterium]